MPHLSYISCIIVHACEKDCEEWRLLQFREFNEEEDSVHEESLWSEPKGMDSMKTIFINWNHIEIW